jgi:hypothetical protein
MLKKYFVTYFKCSLLGFNYKVKADLTVFKQINMIIRIKIKPHIKISLKLV